MEEAHGSALSGERGTALVVVLLAIALLLPPTLVMSALAVRWQRQSIDYRDTLVEEFVAEAGFEAARGRLSAEGIGIEQGESTSFQLDALEGVPASVRVSRIDDVVVTLDGAVLEGIAASRASLEQTSVDAEGRFVYLYRKLELYLVEVEVVRRPTLPAVQLAGVVARLPDGALETLGVTVDRRYLSGSEKPES